MDQADQIQNISQARKEQGADRAGLLLEINNAIVSHRNLGDLLRAVSACLRREIPHDFAGMVLFDPETGQLMTHALDFPRDQGFVGHPLPMEGTPAGVAIRTRKPLVINKYDANEFPAEVLKRGFELGLRSGCVAPLICHDHVFGAVSVASFREGVFTNDHGQLLGAIASQIAIAVENALAFQEIERLKDKLAQEKVYLEDEIRSEQNFEEIIGGSHALKEVLQQVETVAATDSTVLIRGETGTGKELIARAIHSLSDRRARTLVKVNCAAIPMGLLESELFGHEKGAFTGAIAQRIGRFELADRGTLFLDEVGDIPLELQSKLLRVLQEQEFERLGSTHTRKVNVRLIAATNCDLAKMVEDKQFRRDLFYRLNVFPVTMPPLRERPEDIPSLVRYFTSRYAQRMSRKIETIPSETMKALQRWHWPGNVRELENLVERAVILSRGTALEVPLKEMKSTAPGNAPAITLHDSEREHILKILRQTKGRLAGSGGAAELLGMKRTTLQHKLKKLGITPDHI
jgi:formate hydrogenlyase transcriptional activator